MRFISRFIIYLFIFPIIFISTLTYANNKFVTNIEGTLEIRAQDAHAANAVIQYLLKLENGKYYYLHFSHAAPKGVATGDYIRIKQGVIHENIHGVGEINAIPDNAVMVLKSVSTALPASLGAQKTLVMLVNFQDNPSNQPWTKSAINTTVFNTINDMFYESSFHQTTVVGDVAGWFTVPINSTSDCNTVTDNMPRFADQAAAQAGYDVSSYKRKIYIFPNVRSCGWAGLGTVGGQPSQSWINGYNSSSIIGHEMGHNFGLWHSHFLKCPGAVNTGACSVVEYGDDADIMGSGGNAHFNAYQKDRLGWLNYNVSPPITTVSQSGTYTISTYETLNTQVKALKIAKANLADGSTDYYYLEFRQGIGFDSNLASCPNCDFTQGVLVHQGNSKDGNTSNLLDMTPMDGSAKIVTIKPGQSFNDPNAVNGGVTIKVNSISATGANVTVNFGSTPQCVRAKPTMTISPNCTQWVMPGGKATYYIVLKNNDTNCAPTNFNLVSQLSYPNITRLLSQNSIQLAAGGSGAVYFTVQSNVQTAAQTYQFNIKGVDATDSTRFAYVSALFGVM